jgi:medium-chain acyl-[acyl-carrier-protein] hydrolase
MHSNSYAETPWIDWRALSNSARFRVFCLPYAGGGVSVYRSWGKKLGPDIDICPVQLPGRESRHGETPFRDMGPLADAAYEALLPYLDTPFAFFGHSFGALIAFELARRTQQHTGLSRLFVSARRAPHLSEPRPPIAHLPNAAFAAAVQQRYGGIPQAVLDAQDLLDLLLPRLRADFEVLESYECGLDARVSCDVSVFGGQQDVLSAQHLQAWQMHTTGDVDVRMLSGGHLYLESHRTELLRMIADDLTAAPAASEVAR